MSAPAWITAGAPVVLLANGERMVESSVLKVAPQSFTVDAAHHGVVRVYLETLHSPWQGDSWHRYRWTACHPASAKVSKHRRRQRLREAGTAAEHAASAINARTRRSDGAMTADQVREAGATILRLADIMAEPQPTDPPTLGWAHTTAQYDQFHRAWSTEPMGHDGRTLCGKRKLTTFTTGTGLPAEGAQLRAVACGACAELVPLVAPEDRWLLPDLDAL